MYIIIYIRVKFISKLQRKESIIYHYTKYKMKEITVFTPTYNRKKYLERAYKYLKKQTDKNFVWLIIDDGSTDGTEIIVDKWKKEKEIEIIYVKQNNMGKHIAHNKAMNMCNTDFLICLDSDDYFEKEMIEYLYAMIEKYETKNIWGLVGPKKTPKQVKIKNWPIKTIYSKMAYLYEKYKYSGETYILLNVNLIKENKLEFPKFENEKMVPESVLYDRLDVSYDIILCEKPLYIYEYLDEGYTRSGIRYLKNNKNGMAFANYTRAFESKYSCFVKILSFARYNSMKNAFKGIKFKKYKGKSLIRIFGYILSPIFMLNYIIKIKKQNS